MTRNSHKGNKSQRLLPSNAFGSRFLGGSDLSRAQGAYQCLRTVTLTQIARWELSNPKKNSIRLISYTTLLFLSRDITGLQRSRSYLQLLALASLAASPRKVNFLPSSRAENQSARLHSSKGRGRRGKGKNKPLSTAVKQCKGIKSKRADTYSPTSQVFNASTHPWAASSDSKH